MKSKRIVLAVVEFVVLDFLLYDLPDKVIVREHGSQVSDLSYLPRLSTSAPNASLL